MPHHLYYPQLEMVHPHVIWIQLIFSEWAIYLIIIMQLNYETAVINLDAAGINSGE